MTDIHPAKAPPVLIVDKIPLVILGVQISKQLIHFLQRQIRILINRCLELVQQRPRYNGVHGIPQVLKLGVLGQIPKQLLLIVQHQKLQPLGLNLAYIDAVRPVEPGNLFFQGRREMAELMGQRKKVLKAIFPCQKHEGVPIIGKLDGKAAAAAAIFPIGSNVIKLHFPHIGKCLPQLRVHIPDISLHGIQKRFGVLGNGFRHVLALSIPAVFQQKKGALLCRLVEPLRILRRKIPAVKHLVGVIAVGIKAIFLCDLGAHLNQLKVNLPQPPVVLPL